MGQARFRRAARAVWNGPFWIGPLTRPVSTGDAILKVLETIWKGIVVLLAAALSVGMAAWTYNLVASLFTARPLNELILGKARYDVKACEKEFPILVELENRSKLTLGKVSFHLIVRQPGRSTDLNDELSDWDSDAVIPPSTRAWACWTVPELSEKLDPSVLQYSVKVNWANEFTQ